MVKVVVADFDIATEQVTARDFQRDGNGAVVVDQATQSVTEVLTIEPIAQAVIDAREAEGLAARIELALAEIQAAAEAARQNFITALPGKVGAYSLKEVVARRIVSAATPDAADLALFQREASARSLAPEGLAALVVQRAEDWTSVALEIEGIEAEAKAQVDAAPDVATVDVILASLTWPQA